MKLAGQKSVVHTSMKSSRDVARGTVLVTVVSLLASWALTVGMLLWVDHNTAEGWLLAMVIATLIPLAVAPPVAHKVFSLMLALVESRREIERLARTDDLTQTYNRRYFMELTRRELSMANRHNYLVSLLLIDLDDFKQINERLGHSAGDQALAACADAIRATIRREDVVGRFGGDEFLVLASYSDLQSAAMLGERIRKALAQADVVVGGEAMGFKVSIGVVSNQSRLDGADQMLRMADQALKRAKEAGGDRTEVIA